MADPTIGENMRAAQDSMQAASDAIDRSDWRGAERALFEAVERIGRVLRELGTK
jgi:hypothetical protein